MPSLSTISVKSVDAWACCAGARDRALVHRFVRLPHRGAQAHRQCNHDGGGGTERQRVAMHELAGAIPTAVGPRQHRLAIEVALHIGGERLDAGIALLGVLLEGLGQHGVEIAAQVPRELVIAGHAVLASGTSADRMASSSAAAEVRPSW